MILQKRFAPSVAAWLRHSYYAGAAAQPQGLASFEELAAAVTPAHGQVHVHLCDISKLPVELVESPITSDLSSRMHQPRQWIW